MHPAKKFFYVCAGLFLLALSWHLGARSAQAQVGTQLTAFTAFGVSDWVMLTPNGDVYYSSPSTGPELIGNYWGRAVNVERHTLGQLKQLYRTPAPAGR